MKFGWDNQDLGLDALFQTIIAFGTIYICYCLWSDRADTNKK